MRVIENALFSHGYPVKPVKRRPIAAEPDSTTPRGRRRRLVESVLVFIGCVLLLDAIVGDKGLVAMMKARQESRVQEQALERVRAENARLREEVHRLRYDAATIEDLARRELGLIKPGEKVFTIKDIPPADAQR